MAKDFDYDRYNQLLVLISKPKTSRQVGDILGLDDRNIREQLERLVNGGFARKFKIGSKPLRYEALVDVVPPGGLGKRVRSSEKKATVKVEAVVEQKWSPNMIVQPNSNKRLIELHAQNDALRRRELKAPKVYIGSTMGML